jgi:glycosyltransferase involved in cell wall biosynthesis
LDYRDPWTVDAHSDQPIRESTKTKEAKLLAASAATTVVCQSWASLLTQQYGLSSPPSVITNGYDEEELAPVRPFSFDHFAIVYAGHFYPPKRVISPVLAALDTLTSLPESDTQDWRFHYFGPHGDHVRAEATRYNISERVVLHGNVPRDKVLAALRGAGVGIVITSALNTAAEEDKGIVPGKLFEIMGLGTPTLVITPPIGDIHAIAASTELLHTFSGSSTDAIGNFFRRAIRGDIPRPPPPTAYSWATIAERVDSILRNALTRRVVPYVLDHSAAPSQ